MKDALMFLGIVVAIVIASISLFGSDSTKLGAIAVCDGSQNTTCIDGNYRLNNGALQFASSSICIMGYATSTATPVRFNFVTTGATSTFAGTVFWNYGTCL